MILTSNQYKTSWRYFSHSSVYLTLRALAVFRLLSSHMWLPESPYFRYQKFGAMGRPSKWPWNLKKPVLTPGMPEWLKYLPCFGGVTIKLIPII